MSKLVILNHKMNLDYDEIYPYIDGVNKIETKHNLIICPSNIYLTDFMNHCTWGIGTQNVHSSLEGNYTGEISTRQLKSLGIEYSIIGHYERKKYFHESIKQTKDKLNACLDTNIIPILCFGETGDTTEAINSLEQLLMGIEKIDFIIFAYEPLKVSEKENITLIQEQITEIYNYLYERYQTKPNIVYGGGVSSKDINELLKSEYLNGILIGKISSNIEKITKIIKNID